MDYNNNLPPLQDQPGIPSEPVPAADVPATDAVLPDSAVLPGPDAAEVDAVISDITGLLAESHPFDEIPTEEKAAPPPTGPATKYARDSVITIITVLAITLASLVLIALAIAFYWCYTNVFTNKTVYPHIYAAGMDFSGMTLEEAEAALDNYVLENYGTESVTVSFPDRDFVISPEVIGAKINKEEILNEIWSVGHSKGLVGQVKDYLNALDTDPVLICSAGITLDEEAITAAVADISKTVHHEMKECSYKVDEEQETITVTIGETGIAVDEAVLISGIKSAVLSGDYTPISFHYRKTLYGAPDLTDIYEQKHVDAADAYFDEETMTVVPEIIGYGFDLTAANQRIVMAKDAETIVIQMGVIEPEVTEEQLSAIYFADELSSFSTGNLGNSNRTNNITLACKALNGTVIKPGEIFSYNQCLGQRTPEKGYKKAGAYVNGETVQEYGGGICQVSTTLYNCVLYANLEVVARSAHAYPASYVKLGMDATVSWGNPDFKFKNNTDYPIRIEAKVEGGKCKIKLIGTSSGYTVKMDYEILATINYTTIITQDKEKVNKSGAKGYNVVTYRSVYDADGKLVSKKVEAYSSYDPKNIVIYQDEYNQQVEEAKRDQNTDTPDPGSSSGGNDSGSSSGGSTTGSGDSGSTGGSSDSGGGSSGGVETNAEDGD